MSQSKPSKRTLAVHAGLRRSQYAELSEAIFLTQGFAYDSAEAAQARFEARGEDEFIYARYGTPTTAMFEDRLAAIEGTEAAFATASGMAAVTGVLLSQLRAGDHLVAARALFGSCLHIITQILPSYGIDYTLVDGTDLAAWRAALTPKTKMLFFESISNPTLEVADIAGIAQIARDHGALAVVDNVFATPVFSRAAEQGADLIIYSATKHIDGQGRSLGGVILGAQDLVRGSIETFLKHTGAAISPFNAWLMLKGLETLDLRVRAQAATALHLAQALEGRCGVLYPGLASHAQHDLAMAQTGSGGTVLSMDLGSQEAAFAFLNKLQIWTLSNNLGDAKSIITHPATTTHQSVPEETRLQMGITSGLLRLSCGLEDAEDLLQDLVGAL